MDRSLGFASAATYSIALFRLAFATGADIHILTLACDEQLVGSLSKRHAVTALLLLRPFVSTRVQVLFTPF